MSHWVNEGRRGGPQPFRAPDGPMFVFQPLWPPAPIYGPPRGMSVSKGRPICPAGPSGGQKPFSGARYFFRKGTPLAGRPRVSSVGGPVFGRRVFWGWDSCLDCLPGERVPPPGTDQHGSKGNLIRSERPKVQQSQEDATISNHNQRCRPRHQTHKVKKSIIIQSSPAQTGGNT